MKLQYLFRPAVYLFAIQRACTWYPLRRQLAKLSAAFRPRHAVSTDSPAHSLVRDLQRDGYVLLPAFMDGQTIERIKAHLAGAPLNERFAPFRRGFQLDSVPDNVHVAEYSTAHILSCPDVLAIANLPVLLQAASLYLGCKPTIADVSIWWSLVADGRPQEAENFHRDVDDWRFVKFFLYLSDVDADAGPHYFVRGSHRRARFLKKRRLTDAEVRKVFDGRDVVSMQGRTGDAFLEDTFGIHKGQPPRLRHRLLLQVEYAINPVPVYSYAPMPAPGRVDPYINRLFVSQPA